MIASFQLLKINKNKFDVKLIYYGINKSNDFNDNNLYIPNLSPNELSIKNAQDQIKNLNLDILYLLTCI